MALPIFKNPKLLETALTHRSALNEKISPSAESNERLEFLGDAVLELITTVFLYNTLPTEQEGILSAVRATLVRSTTLAEIAVEIGLGKQLYMSAGEEAHGGRNNDSILADAVEALIGAIYLDQGEEKVKIFLEKYLFPKFEKIMTQQLYRNPKGRLQEYVQQKGHSSPVYEVIKEDGPEHDRIFTVQVIVSGKPYGEGSGRSKQLAETAAAQWVMDNLEQVGL